MQHNVMRRTDDDPQPQLLGDADEAAYVAVDFEIEFAPVRFVEVPGNVGFHDVAAHGLPLEQRSRQYWGTTQK